MIFNTIITEIGDKKQSITIINPKTSKSEEFIVKDNTAYLYYNILEYFDRINPNLYCKFGKYKDCVSFSNTDYTYRNEIGIHKTVWLIVIKDYIKVQISVKYENEFMDFYQRNKNYVNELFSTNQEDLESMFNNKRHCLKRRMNKIERYADEIVNEFFMFSLIDTKPLPILMEFLSELPFIKPKENE